MALFPKVVYKFNKIPTKTLFGIFTEMDRLILCHMEIQGTLNSQNNLAKRGLNLGTPDS